MGAQGVGAPRACPVPLSGNSGRKEAALMRREEREERSHFRGPQCCLGAMKRPHSHSSSAGCVENHLNRGLRALAWAGQHGRSPELRALPQSKKTSHGDGPRSTRQADMPVTWQACLPAHSGKGGLCLPWWSLATLHTCVLSRHVPTHSWSDGSLGFLYSTWCLWPLTWRRWRLARTSRAGSLAK